MLLGSMRGNFRNDFSNRHGIAHAPAYGVKIIGHFFYKLIYSFIKKDSKLYILFVISYQYDALDR